MLARRLHGEQRESGALVLVRRNATTGHAFNNTALLGNRRRSEGEKPKKDKRLSHSVSSF